MEWRAGQARAREALRAAGPAGTKLPWYGPPMSIASMATARLMETWAHGQDIARRPRGDPGKPTARLRHVARIGVRARDYAYAVRGLRPPAEQFRVELLARGRRGLIVYRPRGRRPAGHRATTSTSVCSSPSAPTAPTSRCAAVGPDADRWLDLAQAFAGPPGPGRPASGTQA